MTDKKTKDATITEEVIEDTTNGNTQEDSQATNEASDQKEVKTAKAGKRSAKAIAEAEEKAAKEDRKASDSEEEVKPKRPVTPTRSRLERRSKAYRESAKAIDKDTTYNLVDAIALAQKTSGVKFDATVELHVNLNVDPRHADQNIRDNLVLPAGTGKTIRIAVFADEDVKGVDLAGVENITKELDKGNINFDILIATPANMAKLGKYARVLGPRGLMPNPKSGTVTTDVTKAVEQAKAGRVEFRVDSTGIVHVGVGKVSFKAADVEANIRAVLANLKSNKPASVKGTYVKAIHLTTTMGPSITVATSEV